MAQDPYRRIAPWYDRTVGRTDAALKGIARSQFAPVDGMKMLDVGCGTGTALEPYVAAGCLCHGIDASEAMLDKARQRLGSSAELILGDAGALPYEDNSFDLVFTSVFLHELTPIFRSEVLSEMTRVVAPTGRIQVIEYAAGDLTPKGRAVRAFSMVAERIAGKEHKRNCKAFIAEGGVPGLAAIAGLVVEKQKVVAGGNMGIYLLRTASAC
jgi:ubiquinone/menaquinone biosynthesis C-methylase UbiE